MAQEHPEIYKITIDLQRMKATPVLSRRHQRYEVDVQERDTIQRLTSKLRAEM